MKEHFLLGEVAKVLGRKPHQIVHLLTTGKIPEPQVRIANKRLFVIEDVERLARHFRVNPNWDAIPSGTVKAEEKSLPGLVLRPSFEVAHVGDTGHEVRDGDGKVFAWTTDRSHALVLAGLLEAAARS